MKYKNLKNIVTKKTVFIVTGIILVLVFLLGSSFTVFNFGVSKKQTTSKSSEDSRRLIKAASAEIGSKEKYEYLSVQTSNSCGLQPATVETYPDEQRIQGSCCSKMDFHRYQEQVTGLKEYAHLDVIPEDPYDIPAALAKRLLAYQENITLTTEQQAIYNNAVTLSDEGGPCCCKCWRWHAFEGQAKYLITEHNFTAEQIAEVWDIEDGCGGIGHTH